MLMPALVDTTIRLLSQEPLAGRMQGSRVLELAGILDKAGFSYLEVSGGGCFEWSVRRGVESPWERIRAIRARCSTPLGIALRGRFLVGTRPLSRDLVRRFVESAAASGIDVFRLHDPLNDLTNLREAAEAIRAAEKELAVGLVHSPGLTGETEVLLERVHQLGELGASRVLVHDPAGSLEPAQARELVERIGEASGLPVGFHGQGSGGVALAAGLEAARDLIEAIRQYLDAERSTAADGPDARLAIFLDEVTRVRGWAGSIRGLVDNDELQGVTLVATGSHSSDLRQGGERLPGRRGGGHAEHVG